MKIRTFVYIAIFVFTSNTYGQVLKWDNVKFRKAFESETSDDDKAANISFTLPNDGEDFFAINAGIGYEFLKLTDASPKHIFSAFFVYNYNNQIEKEQQNYKGGISHKITFDFSASNFTIFGTSAGEYLKDFREDSHAAVVTTYWHFQKKNWIVPFGGYAARDNRVAYFLLPQIGFEYQNTIESKTVATGYDTRSYFSIGGNVMLRKKTSKEVARRDANGAIILDASGDPVMVEVDLPKGRWNKAVEWIIAYEVRHSLASNIDAGNNYTPLFKTQLKFYPVPDDNFAVSLSYNDGANPIEVLEKQTFWMFTLTYKK